MVERVFPRAYELLREIDPAIADVLEAELKREREGIELIASENVVSPAVLAAMGSVLTNKYAEGYPGRRYYGGCEAVDEVREAAPRRHHRHDELFSRYEDVHQGRPLAGERCVDGALYFR